MEGVFARFHRQAGSSCYFPPVGLVPTYELVPSHHGKLETNIRNHYMYKDARVSVNVRAVVSLFFVFWFCRTLASGTPMNAVLNAQGRSAAGLDWHNMGPSPSCSHFCRR